MGDSALRHWCDELVRADREEDGELFGTAVHRIVAAGEDATPSARDAAIGPIAAVVAAAPPPVGRWAALAAGALVEMGAAPGPLVAPVFDRLTLVLSYAVDFVAAWHEHAGVPLPDPGATADGSEPDAVEAAAVRLEPVLGDDAYTLAMSWWLLGGWMPPALAMLQHFGAVRGRVPDRERVADLVGTLAADPAVGAMAGYRHDLYHLVELLGDGAAPDGHDHAAAPRSAQDELTTARLLVERGDLTTAARHVATALVTASDPAEAYRAVLGLARQAGDAALDLFPVQGQVYVGNVVARAHLLADGGSADDAVELLLSASGYDPRRPWADVPWVTDPGLGARLDPERLAPELMSFSAGLPTPVPEEDRAPLLPYLELAGNALAAHPGHALLHGAAANLARRLGAEKQAVAWASRGESLAPSEMTALFTALAYRSAGDVDETVAAFRRVLGFNPANTAAYTDVAELLAEVGRTDEALSWVDGALAVDPQDPAAFPTACRLRYARDADPAHLVALADYLRAHPDVQHAHAMLSGACDGEPWLSFVPGPGEAVSRFLEPEFLAAGARPVSTYVTALEAPSALTALARALPGLTVSVGDVPEPDIRRPRRAVGTEIWAYDGTTARPVRPEPSADGARAVGEFAALAGIRWPHPTALYDAAVHLGALPLDDLLGVLTYPPEPPDTDTGRQLAGAPGYWLRMVQVAACVGLLHHRADEPWPVSVRRRTLGDLAFGVEDWVTEAATFALAVQGWVDPGARADVAALVAERVTDAADVRRHRVVTIAGSLACIAGMTPGLPEPARRLARSLQDTD